jgi:hypothetical protein
MLAVLSGLINGMSATLHDGFASLCMFVWFSLYVHVFVHLHTPHHHYVHGSVCVCVCVRACVCVFRFLKVE